MCMKKNALIIAVLTLLSIGQAIGGCTTQNPQGSIVTIESKSGEHQLYRNDQPFTILGVGGTTNLELLKSYGGNTIRTWDAEGIAPLMDEAHELGIAVVVGIWLEHARHGFDYADPESRQHDLDRVKQFVLEFRDHPALLAWGVGNEVELGGSMDTAIMQINDAAKIIKSLDTNHPTMSVIAEIGDDKAIRIQNECPQIDMLGINSYGGLGNLAPRIKAQGLTLPYAITEYGVLGHWETGNSEWGAPYEMTSSAKAAFLKGNYQKTIAANLGKQCLGSFAFLWGNKQEKTATWYGLLLETGETTERVDVLSELWTGNPVSNSAPRVESMKIDVDANQITTGQQVHVKLDASDLDGDPLTTHWEVTRESTVVSAGGDHEDAISAIQVEITNQKSRSCTITMTLEPGAYRIFATVRDGQGHAGTANLPILIVE